MDENQIRVLLIDDEENEYLLTRNLLARGNSVAVLSWLPTYEEGLQAMLDGGYDVYLVDYDLKERRDGLVLLRDAMIGGCSKPIIMLTGQGNRAIDMAAMQAGAADYLVKGQFGPELLERVIRYSIERKRTENEKAQLIERLQLALSEIKTLSGFLPICACCKKIRDDQGYWRQVEVYIRDHTEAELSHSFCPECAEHAIHAYEEEIRALEKEPQVEG